MSGFRILFVLAAASLALGQPGAIVHAKQPVPQKVLSSIVRISATVPVEARTAQTLGTERNGSGVVIDDEGLVVTIGYLVLEAESVMVTTGNGTIPANVVAYDHDSGFGLVRTVRPPGVPRMELGASRHLRTGKHVLVSGFGGRGQVMPAAVVDRRDFAGYWEYLLEDAIFTSPLYPEFGGAALIDEKAKLVGIGSLMVPNAATRSDDMVPGNMFVPIDALTAVLGDLISRGRSSRNNRPWLGLYSEVLRGRLFVARVVRRGPAWSAGVRPGDMVLGVGDNPVSSLADFYRKVWAYGDPGVEVPLQLLQGNTPRRITVRSRDRYDWLRLSPSY